MFAERPEDTLMFQVSTIKCYKCTLVLLFVPNNIYFFSLQLRGDAPELMETEFASRLDTNLLHHLQVTNSVPAFLASVTLDLFESQTFMG